jgi:hypothetical protein
MKKKIEQPMRNKITQLFAFETESLESSHMLIVTLLKHGYAIRAEKIGDSYRVRVAGEQV